MPFFTTQLSSYFGYYAKLNQENKTTNDSSNDLEGKNKQNMTLNTNNITIDISEPNLTNIEEYNIEDSNDEDPVINIEDPVIDIEDPVIEESIKEDLKPTLTNGAEVPYGHPTGLAPGTVIVDIPESEKEKHKNEPYYSINRPAEIKELDSQTNYFDNDPETLTFDGDHAPINEEYEKKQAECPENPLSVLETNHTELEDLKKTEVKCDIPVREHEVNWHSHPNLEYRGCGGIGWSGNIRKGLEFYSPSADSLGNILEDLKLCSAPEQKYGFDRLQVTSSSQTPFHITIRLPSYNWQNPVLVIKSEWLKSFAQSRWADLLPIRDAYRLIKKVELRGNGQLLNHLDGYGIWFFNQLLKLPNYDYFNRTNIIKGILKVPIPFDFMTKYFYRMNALYNMEITLEVYLNAAGRVDLMGDALYLSKSAEKKIMDKSWEEITKVYHCDQYALNMWIPQRSCSYTFGMDNDLSFKIRFHKQRDVIGLLFYLIDPDGQMVINNSLMKSVSLKIFGKEKDEEILRYSIEDLLVEGFYHLGTEYSDKWMGYYWFPFSRKNDWDNQNFKSYSGFNFLDESLTPCLVIKFDNQQYKELKKKGEHKLVMISENLNVLRHMKGFCGLSYFD